MVKLPISIDGCLRGRNCTFLIGFVMWMETAVGVWWVELRVSVSCCFGVEGR